MDNLYDLGGECCGRGVWDWTRNSKERDACHSLTRDYVGAVKNRVSGASETAASSATPAPRASHRKSESSASSTISNNLVPHRPNIRHMLSHFKGVPTVSVMDSHSSPPNTVDMLCSISQKNQRHYGGAALLTLHHLLSRPFLLNLSISIGNHQTRFSDYSHTSKTPRKFYQSSSKGTSIRREVWMLKHLERVSSGFATCNFIACFPDTCLRVCIGTSRLS